MRIAISADRDPHQEKNGTIAPSPGPVSRPTRSSARRRGATIVEGAVVLVVAFLLIMGLFEFSRWLMIMNVCSNAARNGARVAVAHTDSLTTTQLVDYIHGMLPKAARPFQGYNKNVNIKIFNADQNGNRIGSASDPNTWKNAGFNEYIAVEITGRYRPIMPMGLPGISYVNIRSFALMYSEAN